MKQYRKFRFGVLMLALAGMASCSSDDSFSDGANSGEPVKTQFSISVPAGKGARLAQDIVQGQNTPVFRGMENIYLIPFSTQPSANGSGNATPIELGLIESDELQAGTNAKVYYNVSLAEGTTHFLFYGEAYSANDNAVANGAIDATIPQAVSSIAFKLRAISPDATSDDERSKILNALNTLVKTAGWNAATSDLKNYYDMLTQLKAGSAASVKIALDNLTAGINNATADNEDALQTTVASACSTAVEAVKDLTYPANLGLPDGAAKLEWDKNSNQFQWADDAPGSLSAETTPLTKYVYPASLYYMANTDIKTSDAPQADNYATDWTTCLGLYSGNSVSSNTQSVALVKPVQYAVARLDVAAKFASPTVPDNLSQDVDINTNNGITLSGILLSTYQSADWTFYANASASDNTGYIIYDPSITANKLGTSDITNTIQAQTLTLASNAGEPVKFALELVNNTGSNFTGFDGMVPAGGKFYLVGQLTPQTSAANNRVFEQAYNTKANVTINSLSHAYNCIPDLANPKLELGLSVNLEWTAGLVDNVTIE